MYQKYNLILTIGKVTVAEMILLKKKGHVGHRSF